MSRQRLRIRYAIEASAQAISQVETLRLWERAIRTALAEVGPGPPQVRIAIAAPLPQTMTGEAEVLDATLGDTTRLQPLVEQLPGLLPPGIRLISIEEVGLGLPSLQNELRWAEFSVRLEQTLALAHVEAAVAILLGRDSLPWEEPREKKTRQYDLRGMIDSIRVGASDNGVELTMRLRAVPAAMGRPEQVLLALGLPPAVSIRRMRLIFAAAVSPVRQAWRARGRFLE